MREFTKAEEKKLRALAAQAHARELDAALRELDSAFADWRMQRIDDLRLTQGIREFHHGRARELHNDYARLDAGFLLPRALGRGVLEESEVPKALRSAPHSIIDYVRGNYEEREA
jgi:hypothetical protein